MTAPLEIFLVVAPGFEEALASEAQEAGFKGVRALPGGVVIDGDWSEVWRANLVLRGATRVLARIAEFRAMHLAQLDKRARKVDWAALLGPETPVKVECTCRKSRIYHDRAARDRIARAIHETLGAPISLDASLIVKARIDDDLCTISIDTSGESLHKRGHKVAVNKAPMRETLASLMLRDAGFDGTQTVLDPMCGSGTFVIEAAERAAGYFAGRARRFAFVSLTNFDAHQMSELKTPGPIRPAHRRFFGFDRDVGAINMSQENADRAGVKDWVTFDHAAISDLTPPEIEPGLVVVNPPYGGRIGNKKLLYALYGTFGSVMRDRFEGWRVVLITNEPGLAKATELTFAKTPRMLSHGGLKVGLYKTEVL